jgi:hypothetical protein
MRNLKPLILGIIIGALATYFFCPRQGGEEPSDETAKTAEIIKPEGVISVAEGKKLFKNWENNNRIVADSTMGDQDSKKRITNVGWSLKDIKDYLAYAEATSNSLGYTMTGLTVYMGNYGTDTDPEKKNENTLFIVPTGNEKTSSEASMIPITFQGDGKNLPTPPLNRGTGGDGDY